MAKLLDAHNPRAQHGTSASQSLCSLDNNCDNATEWDFGPEDFTLSRAPLLSRRVSAPIRVMLRETTVEKIVGTRKRIGLC